jgi:hypothetical protein
MLRCVGQRLGCNEVHRDLDGFSDARFQCHVEFNGDRRTPSERPQSRSDTALGEDRGMDPTRDLLKVRHGLGESRRDAGQLGSEVIAVRSDHGLGGARHEGKGDQSLLRAVVEVSFDPASGLVGRGDDPPA